MPNFFRSFLVANLSKLKLAAILSSVGLTTTGFLWFQQQHHASSYSTHLKRYTATAEYPQLSKHSNLMAKALTPQVRNKHIERLNEFVCSMFLLPADVCETTRSNYAIRLYDR